MKLQWESVTYTAEDGRVVFIEIIPTDGHIESKDCPCGPWLAQDCGECDDFDEPCWKCGGRGLVDYEPWGGEVPWAVHEDERLQ